MEWDNIPREEQETVINIDYFEKEITVYTSRKSVADRLIKKIGEPSKVYTSFGKVYAIDYKRSLFDKDIAKFFSKGLLVGAFKETDKKENEETEINED